MGSGAAPIVALVVCLAVLATGCSEPTSAPRPDAAPSGSATSASTPPAESGPPAWASQLPARTRQVIRTVSSDRWCSRVYCTTTQAWERRHGAWLLVREFGSTIGPHGWGKRRQNDGRTPAGTYRIKVTFSTTPGNPGRMPWRRRLPTSTVTDKGGRLYNTWIEEPGRTNGDRPSMRWGFVVNYNHVRLHPGLGAAPVPDAGSGIFYHTSRPRHRWEPSEGCTRVEDPRDMRWLLSWLRPAAHPRVVQNL
jgi:L,D-peptidoglycan transpeptidase YkuD (ErfK/YbiS/YcfS/YnhG family)